MPQALTMIQTKKFTPTPSVLVWTCSRCSCTSENFYCHIHVLDHHAAGFVVPHVVQHPGADELRGLCHMAFHWRGRCLPALPAVEEA